MPRTPLVYAEGPPAVRGRKIGAALGDLIDMQLRGHHERLTDQGLGDDVLQRMLQPYLAASEGSLPHLVELLRGMAEGADASFWHLLAMNALEELEPLLAPAAADRCSTLTVRVGETTILAHNEQWYASDAGLTAIVVERPESGAAVVSPTSPCYLPAVGLNAHGGAQGIDSLTAADDGTGIPRVLVSRHALEARDRADAVQRAGIPGRAGGYAHVFAFPDGDALVLETTADRLALIEGTRVHTNHYLSPELAALADAPGAGSRGRHDRLVELLEDRPPASVEDVMELMRDHSARPDPICLHADSGSRDDSCVVFSMICDIGARRMWVAPGNPCTNPYEEVDLDAAFS